MPPPSPEQANEILVPWPQVEGFIAQLAHDVRNGLNACELQLTFLGEICDGAEAADEVKRLRVSLQAITKQLQALRTATGPTSAMPLAYPAGDFFEDLRERLQKLHPAEAGRVTWEIDLDPACQLLIDPTLSLQACLEMLENAFQHGAAGSPVQCTAAASGSAVAFTVSAEAASAPSIPPEQWGRQPLLSTKRAGYGLGLFRARRIAEAQGGTLRASYSEADRRLAVILTLPTQPA